MVRKKLLLLSALLLIAACKADLYSNITEREANEMMAVLFQNGIHASKTPVKDELFNLQVDASDISGALLALDEQGLPRNERKSIGEVFQRSGMISSPFEERVRYIYALGEEVAQTLQQIDGILVARVHIVMPEEPALGQVPRPSSAAVFIRYQPGRDFDFLTPQIRRLVSSSIEGVEYEAVTVVLIEAQASPVSAIDAIGYQMPLPGLSVRKGSIVMFWSVFGSLAGIATLFMASTLFFALRGRKRSRNEDGDEETA